jgi:hypothetical protein
VNIIREEGGRGPPYKGNVKSVLRNSVPIVLYQLSTVMLCRYVAVVEGYFVDESKKTCTIPTNGVESERRIRGGRLLLRFEVKGS